VLVVVLAEPGEQILTSDPSDVHAMAAADGRTLTVTTV